MNAVTEQSRVSSASSYGVLALFLVMSFATASFGTMFPPDSWYTSLVKPSWNPPNWLFGPVWTVLYAMNAVAAWRVYRRGSSLIPISVWILHLVPNALWSMFFFGMHRMDYALVNIVVLLCTIVTTAVLFFRQDRIAGLLMVPYFLWVSFATFLNWTLMSLNLNAF
jgi:translocator protein